MAAELRCTHCGQSILIHPTPSGKARCMHCGKRMTIPPLLASLPTPQIPGETLDPAPPEEQVPLRIEVSSEPESGEPVAAVMARMMPWVISALMHAGLMLVMVFVAMVVIVPAEEVFAPVDVGPFAVDGTKQRIEHPSPVINDDVTPWTGGSESLTYPRDEALSTETTATSKRVVIGTGMSAAASVLSPRDWGTGGPPGGTIIGDPPDPRQASHIVFVIDKSGSMMAEFDRVRHEMLRYIGFLRPVQDFHIILFADGPPVEFLPRRLVPSDDLYKMKAAEWLQTIRAGSIEGHTDPAASLGRAFDVLARADKRRPGKLLVLLTDGVFLNNEKILKLIETRNADGQVRINAFLYGHRPPEAVKAMKTIALKNKGMYKYISPDE